MCQSRSLHGRGRQVHSPEGDMTPVMQGPVNDTGEEPFSPSRRVWQNCPCHGRSPAQKSNLNIVPTGSDVCGVLHCSRDGWVGSLDQRAVVPWVTQFREFFSVLGKFAIICRLRRAAAVLEEATHTSRAALRPGTAAVVKVSAGLDCEAVGPGFRCGAWVCKF